MVEMRNPFSLQNTSKFILKCLQLENPSVLRLPFVKHQRTQKGEMHICSECGESFLRKSQLTKDERIHWGEKLHGSHTYEKPHTTKSRLTEHQKIHTREKSYRGECGQVYYRKLVVIRERHERVENPR